MENSQGRIRKSFLAESGRIGESDNFIKFKIKTFLVSVICWHQGRYVRLYTRRRTRSYRKLQSNKKNSSNCSRYDLRRVKNKTEMTWIPADDGLYCWGCPQKWRAGRYFKREQHAVICSRAVNVKYPCNVEFFSKSFKKFMNWHSPK